jgi:hypothetical protein
MLFVRFEGEKRQMTPETETIVFEITLALREVLILIFLKLIRILSNVTYFLFISIQHNC